jgi:hypothetical protein
MKPDPTAGRDVDAEFEEAKRIYEEKHSPHGK